MIFSLTTAGRALVQSTPGSPPILDEYRIGSSYNYSPAPGQQDIVGMILSSGEPSFPLVHPDNIVQYTVLLPPSIGDFFFGEVGLYKDGVLIAIGVSGVPIRKLASSSSQSGNYLNLSAYVTLVNGAADIFAEIGNSMDNLSIEVAYSVDSLPPASIAAPNVRIVPNHGSTDSSLALSNSGKWSVSGYETVPGVTVATTTAAMSVVVSTTSDVSNFTGDVLVQCLNGSAAGLIRRALFNPANSTFLLLNPWSVLPAPGTSMEVLRRVSVPESISAFLRGLDPGLAAEALNELVDHPISSLLRRDGSNSMLGPLNMGGSRIHSVASPVHPSDVVNLGFLTSTIAELNLPPDPNGDPVVLDGGTF